MMILFFYPKICSWGLRISWRNFYTIKRKSITKI